MKLIDVKRETMEMDKRIKDVATIQTILKHNSNDIGRKGYFFDEFWQTKDLNNRRYGKLVDIIIDDNNHDLCFKAELESGFTNYFRFFIPESDLKPIEKTYRPYTLNEFIDQYHLGDEVIVRRKLNKDRSIHKLFTEYGGNDDTVHLGTYWYTFQALYDGYEIYTNKGWQPFGVLDDNK